MAKTKEQLQEQLTKLYEQQEKAIAENADRDWLIAISNAIIETTYQLQKAGN